MKRLYKHILKLQVDFLVSELKTLHKLKKLDEDLDKKDNFSKVFQTGEQLLKEGFINASDNDFISFNENNNKIGLIYH